LFQVFVELAEEALVFDGGGYGEVLAAVQMRLLLEMQKAFEVDVEEVLPQQGFFHLLSSMFIS
jgi:hypothetical protein